MLTVKQQGIIKHLSDLEVFARTLYGEARGECKLDKKIILDGAVDINDSRLLGLIAVGQVIINRAKQKKWYGHTIREVCLKPYQFSCWNMDDPNLDIILKLNKQDKIYNICLQIAQALMNGECQDTIWGADHYYAIDCKPQPSWAKYCVPVIKIGRHYFLKMKPCHQ